MILSTREVKIVAHAYTKNLIREKVVDYLDKKPIAQISVKEIAEACEISRNTFYYYYQDVYDVLSDIFNIELERVIGKYSMTGSWEDSFIWATSFAMEHRRCIYHVYHSMQREELERYLYHISGDVMLRFVLAQNKEIGASEYTCQVIAQFYQGALTQMVLQWVALDMKDDPTQYIRYVGALFDGNIVRSLKKGLNTQP